MTIIVCHRGLPCTPPIVNGILFEAHPEDTALYVAEVTEQQASELTRIPAFTRFGGDTSKLTTPPVAPSATPVSLVPSRRRNADLLAKATADWDLPSVQAKAEELGIESADKAGRSDLIALVNASEAVVPDAPPEVMAPVAEAPLEA